MVLAATRLIALHKNKGKSVAACLKSRTDYAQNPDKTQQGELVSSYECSPLTVDEEFMLSKRQYELATGRRQKSDVIAYQIRQSFKPGEITAEEANKVGYELAMRFTKGKYGHLQPLRKHQRCAAGNSGLGQCPPIAESDSSRLGLRHPLWYPALPESNACRSAFSGCG